MAALKVDQRDEALEGARGTADVIGRTIEENQPGIGELLGQLIPIAGLYFSSQVGQKFKKQQEAQQLGHSIILNLAQQGIYEPSIAAKVLGDKKAAAEYENLALVKSLEKKKQNADMLNTVAQYVNGPTQQGGEGPPTGLERLERENEVPGLTLGHRLNQGESVSETYLKAIEELRKRRVTNRVLAEDSGGEQPLVSTPSPGVTAAPTVPSVPGAQLGDKTFVATVNGKATYIAAPTGEAAAKTLDSAGIKFSDLTEAQGPVPVQRTQPYQVAPFPVKGAPSTVESTTFHGSGDISQTKKPASLDERITGYVREQITQGGYQALGPALREAYAKTRGAPKDTQLAELKAEATQLAYQEGLQRFQGQYRDPVALHRAAIQYAAQQLGANFNGKGLEVLRDPVAEHRAQVRAGYEERGAYAGTPAAEGERKIEAGQAGTVAQQTGRGSTVGKAEGSTEVSKSPAITLEAAQGAEATQYYDKATGERLTGQEPAADVAQRQGKGEVIKLQPAEATKLTQIRSAASALQPLFTLYAQVYGPGGIFSKMDTGLLARIGAGGKGLIAQLEQNDPALITAIRQSTLAARRAVKTAGDAGALSDKDVEAGEKSLVDLQGLPDNPLIARSLVKQIVDTLNREQGAILQNPKFLDAKYLVMPNIIVPSKPRRR